MAASEKTGRDVHGFQIVSFDPSQVVTVFFFVYSQINIHPCIIFKYYFGSYKFSFVLSG